MYIATGLELIKPAREMTKLRILFLTKYSRLGASSRYRAYQYLPFLEQAGFEGAVWPLFSSAYLQQTYIDRPRWLQQLLHAPLIVGSYTRRWRLIKREISQYDVVYLEYEVFPYLPAFFESALFQSNRPVVVDYDDAVYLNYEQHSNLLVRRILRSKISNVVQQSSQVITANRNLARWAGQSNPNVTIIPTSVDLRKYCPDPVARPANDKPVIGWIGTPITAKYLRLLEEPLRTLRSRYDFILKLIGAPDFKMDGIEILHTCWTESSEVGELRACDIGVMPVPDEPWAYGKSALKLVQYLAAGVAAVASPIGANGEVVRDGENGLLAETETDWVKKLSLLIEQPALRKRLAEAGRQTVEERFSVQVNASRFVDVLRQAALS